MTAPKNNKFHNLNTKVLIRFMTGVMRHFSRSECITLYYAAEKINSAGLQDGEYNYPDVKHLISEEEYNLLIKWYELVPENVRDALEALDLATFRELTDKTLRDAKLKF
jgi:hypothetical protein